MIVAANPVIQPVNLLLRARPVSHGALPRGAMVFTSSGRGAIYTCLEALGVAKGTGALLPAFVCSAVVDTFRAYGCEVMYYGLDERLRYSVDDMDRLLGQAEAHVLVVVHYFGFPMPGFEALVRKARDQGLLVIEDCAHALFSCSRGTPLGSWGDAAAFSLRKTLAVPEGGIAVISKESRASCPQTRVRWKLSEVTALARELLFWSEVHLGVSVRSRLLRHERFRGWMESRNSGVSGRLDRAIGRISYGLFWGTCAEEIAVKRRRNFTLLADQIRKLPGVRMVYSEVPDGTCPLGLPIVVTGRDEVVSLLYRRGVHVRIFWERAPAILRSSGDAQTLSEGIVVLPIHEGLEEDSIGYIAEVLKCR